jgi:hypothetical protein
VVNKLESVPNFKYLGITLQTAGTIVTIKAMSSVDNLEKVSLNTTLKPFELKIMPVFTGRVITLLLNI